MKIRSVYVCTSCQYQTSQWVGQCPNCQEWNTLVEDVVTLSKNPSKGGKSSKSLGTSSQKVIRLSEVATKQTPRINTGINEFDRVLGGGFVPGQVILMAGEPGVGKSTLLTQISKVLGDKKVIYICGEESIEQIKIRTQRMGYKAENLYMLQETDVDEISAVVEANPDAGLVIVDSIQTIYSSQILGNAGSMTQVRGSTQILTTVAKNLGIPLILVGHITKEGVVAGPKVLEHIVDTVLYLEGDSQHMFRMLRTSKNRFGPVSEVGIFEMTEAGMTEVSNPSEIFLSERMEDAAGSCVCVVMEGQRPLLFEVQALTVKTAFGYPRRTTSGYNVNRLQVLIAILEKRCGLNLSTFDVYLNIAGGFKVSEYASDLAVCLAIASAVKDKPLKAHTVAFGEVGLNGEIRKVSHQEKRSKEAKKLGYKNLITPEEVKSLNRALDLALK